MTTTDTDPFPEPMPETERSDITRTRPPRARRTQRRLTPAGHAILALLVAFALGSLFNADSMLQTAQTQTLGSQRHAFGVALMRPVHALSEFLRLDRPRRRLDQALGHGQPSPKKGQADPFATPSTTKASTRGTTTGTKPPDKSTRHEALTVSRRHPATIFVAGDSLSAEFGTSLYRIAASSHVYRAAGDGAVDFKVSSGLARPDYFNWPAELTRQVSRLNPEIVVLMLGSNDNQPLRARDGHTYAFASAGWKQEYHRRVGAVMDQLIARNRWVAYVGVPILATRNEQWPVINTVIREEAAKRARAVYVDSFSLFQDPNGHYTQYLPNDQGQLVQVRTADGIHFQRAGADLLARRTVDLMEQTIVKVSRK
jgi:hypothetical protein